MDQQTQRHGLPLFLEQYDCSEWRGAARSHLILSTRRSGSTLLAELFRATGRLGVPAEYLTRTHMLPRLAPRLGAVRPDGAIDMSVYLRALVQRRTTANGLFGMIVHFRDIRPRWPASRLSACALPRGSASAS